MNENETRRKLEKITDPGLFEKLSHAVLREDDNRCRRLAQTGVNVDGKTVKGTLDGVVYLDLNGKRHMLAVQHTTCRASDLRRKWLHESNGDVAKTVQEFKRGKKDNPNLGGTLILTTNREPPQSLLHDVELASQSEGLEVRVYSVSALAHFLDFEPKGQWIRQEFLSIEPTHLSAELLKELSKKSIGFAQVMDDPNMWIDRHFDDELGVIEGQLQFVVGESGVGKSIACLKYLQNHVTEGGFGLILTDQVLSKSLTIEDAVERSLKRLQATLADGVGREALSLVSDTNPLVIVVEDINRSPQPVNLLETLISWSISKKGDGYPSWRLLCPAWPSVMGQIRQEASKIAADYIMTLGVLATNEAIQAVKMRSKDPVTSLQAQEIAESLECDPLLIALHGYSDSEPNQSTVISEYVDKELDRLSSSVENYTAGEYRNTLRWLSLEMLERRQLSPKLSDVFQWTGEQDTKEMIRELVRTHGIVRIDQSGYDVLVAFRHDRVRDQVLADAISDAQSRNELSEPVMSDPFFAEIIGIALCDARTLDATISKITETNPLALFYVLKHRSNSLSEETEQALLGAAQAWVGTSEWKEQSNSSLRNAILSVLSSCDGKHVAELAKEMGDGDPWALRARFRNGDVAAGLHLCALVEPGVGWVGHVELIDHVTEKYGDSLIHALDRLLRQTTLHSAARTGALRLAGYVASPKLENAIRESWVSDSDRENLLTDYFWAGSQCCGNDPSMTLAPMFDAWEELPDEDEDGFGSPRTNFGADRIRWAFRDRVPFRALAYFLKRARGELAWPITVILNGIDHPDAVEFLVVSVAERIKRAGDGMTFPFADFAIDEWRDRKRWKMRSMSQESRDRLQVMWSDDQLEAHIRERALHVWGATMDKTDISVLQTIDLDSDIGDTAHTQRLRRGDRSAIPELITKLNTDESAYWWQMGRYIWTNDLTDCLDRTLARRAEELRRDVDKSLERLDRILAEMLVELPERTAERLIEKHWAGLSRSGVYITAALYVASTKMARMVRDVIQGWDTTNSPLDHIGMIYGIHIEGRRGITRIKQLEVLLPYLSCMSDQDITLLWDECNRNRWFDWRRRNLDSRVESSGMRSHGDEAVINELERLLKGTGPILGFDHWKWRFLDTGRSVPDVMELVHRWLTDHKAERALRIAAAVVTQFGTRENLNVLSVHELANSEYGQSVIQNASFTLSLRSLN